MNRDASLIDPKKAPSSMVLRCFKSQPITTITSFFSGFNQLDDEFTSSMGCVFSQQKKLSAPINLRPPGLSCRLSGDVFAVPDLGCWGESRGVKPKDKLNIFFGGTMTITETKIGVNQQ